MNDVRLTPYACEGRDPRIENLREEVREAVKFLMQLADGGIHGGSFAQMHARRLAQAIKDFEEYLSE